MSQYDNRNSFVLFPNRNLNPKAPAYSGTFTDESGKEWEIVAWKKTSKKGSEFLAGKLQEKKRKPEISDEDIDF